MEHSNDKEKIIDPRRKFINWLLGITGTAVAGSIIYPIFKYLIPPETTGPETTSVVAASLNEIPVNGYKIFKFGTKPAIIIRLKEEQFIAFSAKCTHLDCIVQYRQDFKMIWCACHNGLYDLTGKNVSGPPPRPLEKYNVNILGDKVIVSRT